MRLHAYVAKRFLWTFLALLAVFVLFLALLDLVEQVRRYDDLPFSDILRLVALNTPEATYQILPLVMILATIALFIALARSSELVVIRSSGRSGLITVFAPVVVALVLGGLAVAMFNPVVAATSKRYVELREVYRSGGSSSVSLGEEGLWLRQGAEDGQSVIHANRTSADATSLYDVTFVTYAPGAGPVRRIEAEQATLSDGLWTLTGVKSWALSSDGNPERNAEILPSLTLASTLTVERIRDSFGNPSAVPIWELPTYIAELEESGFSARRHVVWFWMELAKPLFLTAMVLVGASFTMRHSRLGKTGVSVLSAILLGFGLYYVRNFAQILGENGQLDPILAAWTPPIASILLALGLLLQREES